MAHFREGSSMAFIAGADLSALQNCAVKLNASGNIVAATAATDVIIGTLQDAPASGRTGTVRLRTAAGTLNIVAGGTVAIGDAVTANSSSQGITTTTAGNQIIGYALEAGATGQVIELLPSLAKY